MSLQSAESRHGTVDAHQRVMGGGIPARGAHLARMIRLLGRLLHLPVTAIVTERRIIARGLRPDLARGLTDLMALVPSGGVISISNLGVMPHWARAPFMEMGLRFLAGTPVATADGSRAALLVLDHRLRGPLTSTERTVLEEFSALAGVLVETGFEAERNDDPAAPVLGRSAGLRLEQLRLDGHRLEGASGSRPRRSAELSIGLLEAARLGLLRVDVPGTIIELDGLMPAALGLTPGVLGRSMYEVCAEWPGLILTLNRALEGQAASGTLNTLPTCELHCRPEVAADGTVVGAVAVLRERAPEEYSPQDSPALALKRALRSGEASYSSRLRSALARADAALEEARRQAINDERLRIAREMHDGLGKELFGLAMLLESVAESQKGRAVQDDLLKYAGAARRLGNDGRALLRTFRETAPPGFAQRLRALAAQIQAETEVPRVHLDLPEHLPELDQAAVHELGRVVQEALENVRRHAGASNVWLTVSTQGSSLVLQVDDDGQGFSGSPPAGRFGLLGMRERIELLSGLLVLESSPRGGARVEARVPLINLIEDRDVNRI